MFIPALKSKPLDPDEHLIGLEEMPEWARPAFEVANLTTQPTMLTELADSAVLSIFSRLDKLLRPLPIVTQGFQEQVPLAQSCAEPSLPDHTVL